MTEWIPVNLPWKLNVSIPLPPYPKDIVDKKVTELFGNTKEELITEFEKNWGKHIYDIEYDFIEQLTDSDKLSEEDIDRSFDESTDPIIIDCNKIKKQIAQISEFIEALPEIIQWNIESDEVTEKERDTETKICFAYSPLNRPGVLIEVQDTDDENPNPPAKYLIGTINRNAGVCDDCTAFNCDAIVIRAMVLISQEVIDGIS